MAFINSDQIREVIRQRPEGVMAEDILNDMMQRGYEIEGYNAEFHTAEMFSNMLPSAGRFVKDVSYAFRHPIQTGKGLAKAGKAVGEKGLSLFGADISPESEQILEQLGTLFGARYGTGDRIRNTIEKDPVGFISDIAALATGVGGALKGGAFAAGKLGNAARVSKISKMMEKAGQVGIKTGKIIEPTILVTDRIAPQAAKAIRKSSEAFMKTGAGDWINEHALAHAFRSSRVSTEKAKTIGKRIYDETWSKTAARFGIHGTPTEMKEQSLRLARLSKSEVDASLSAIHGRFKNKDVTTALDELESWAQNKTIRSPQMGAVRPWIDEMRRIHETRGLTLTEMNNLKRAFDEFDNPYKSKAEISGIGTVTFVGDSGKAKDLAFIVDNLRETIDTYAKDNGFRDYRKLNDQTRWGVQSGDLLDDVRLTYADKQNIVDSMILISGVTGTIITADVGFLAAAAGVTFARQYMKSPKFASAVANATTALRDERFEDIVTALRSGQHTRRSRNTFRQIFKQLQPAFPEIRIASRIAQTQGVQQ